MRIVVYDIAADSGGALSVLRQYHRRALADAENDYLFMVGLPRLEASANVRVERFPQVKKSWAARVRFDVLEAHKVVRAYGADEVLSLQNLTVPFVKARQAVYMHNILPRPLCDVRFSLLREPKLWVYQNVIGRLIVRSMRRADEVIVQAGWIAERCARRCGVARGKIRVERPIVALSAEWGGALSQERDGESGWGPAEGSAGNASSGFALREKTSFVYPASAEPFKNHQVVVSACEKLVQRGLGDFQVVFTLAGDENSHVAALRERVESCGLPIVFAGWQGPDEMRGLYEYADVLVFPSKVETIGLPLEEAKLFGLEILAADAEYAHETVGSYENARYFASDDADALAALMESCVNG